MFGKEDFIETIEVIRRQNEYDIAHAVLLEKVIKANDVPVYDNSELVNHFFSLMQKQFPPAEDGTCEIERYCSELNFGFLGGTERVLTPEDLWDTLIKQHGQKKEEKRPPDE